MAHTETLAVSGISTSPRGLSGAQLARRRAFGRAVFGFTSVACVASLVLDLHTGTYSTLAYVFVALALAVMGVLLTTRIPENRVSWVLAFSALVWAIIGLSLAYAVEALVADPGALPLGLAAAWLNNWGWAPGLAFPLSAMLVLVPDGRLVSRRWWPVPAAVVVGTLLVSLLVSVSPTFDLSGTEIANPLTFDSTVAGVAGVVGGVLLLGGLVGSVLAFGVRFRRSEGDERQQLRWVGLSLGIAVPLAVTGALLWGVMPGAWALPALALLALPAGVAIAVLKYRLYDLDLVVNRAVVYGVLTIAVVGGYVAVVGLVGSYVSRRGDVVVSLVVTGLVAVCFQPLRERVQRSVNRLMYGERGDPYAAIAGLGRSLVGATELDAVLPAAVETIARTLALQHAAVMVPETEGAKHKTPIAVYGTPGGEMLVFPLIHQGVSIGELRLTPRRGERFRERDRRLVADLAPQVAGALRAVTLSHELQSTRQRIVELREEERRRIRRDLHDGLGPALAGLTFTLEAVRNLADSDLERADELLVAATEQVQTMIGDIRRLIYGLRPPALDQLGLAGSLRGLATREALPETDVLIEAPSSLPTLPAAVEVAAYWITQEALTNVKRHARARACKVRLAVEPDALRLAIEDDGVGLANGFTGIGLQTMKERAAEVGGTCEIVPRATGGTRVIASLPRLGKTD
jgi:signal transduction histidine kinase